MRLNWIEMENFRQYNGNHRIEFANGDKNITLILGENNAGKTSIYRALMFGLYGDRVIAQDSLSTKIHLVNLKALNNNRPVEGTVKVSISNNKGEYIVKRSIKAVNINEKYTEDSNDYLSLDFRDRTGNYIKNYVEDRVEIQEIINKILDKNIKEFFLFDGEKIETLARTGSESRKEVKNGIIKLMKIDKLDEIRKVIHNLESREKRRLTSKSSDNKLKQLETKINEIKNNIEVKKNQKEEYEKNLILTNEVIKDIEVELRKSESIRELFECKDELIKKLNKNEEIINLYKKNLIDYHFKKGSSIILYDYFIKINRTFKNELLEKDDLISIHVIEETLDKGICLCCNQEVSSNKESIAFLENIKRNYKPSKVTRLMEVMNRECLKYIETKDETVSKIKEILEEISKLNNESEMLKLKIAEINEKTSEESKNEDQIKNQVKRYDKLLKNKKEIEIILDRIYSDIEDSSINLKEFNLEYNRLLKQDSTLNYEIKRLEVLIKLSEKLNKIYNKYINITREKLGEETTRTFNELIDYEKMSMVDNIFISDKYEMDVLDSSGRNITQDISQGQQLVVALSLVTSLAKIASKNRDKVEYPLFMDTAFSKLSKENRRNLIENLPNLTLQWIPLLTDTEYTSFEKDIFERTEKVGKVYKIIKLNKYESKIVLK